MKKSLLAIAAISAFASAAQAQSSVTVYGIVDVGVMGQTNTGNLNSTTFPISSALAGTGAGGGSYVKPGTAFGGMGGGESQSRLGFKGSEDLGNGTKAIFTLEQGFNPMTGSLADTGMAANGKNQQISGDTSLQGQLFNRGAYAGLSNDTYGTLTAGRQQNLMLDNIAGYDPVVSQVVSPLQYSGAYGGGGRTDNSRVNQALKYVWKANGFNANLLYAPGGVAGSTSTGTTTGAQVGYETAKWGVQAIASHTADSFNINGMDAGSGTYGYTASLVNTTAYQLTAKWSPVDKLWIKGGYEREQIGTPSNFQSYAGYSQTVSGVPLTALTAGATNWFTNVLWIGAQYDVTPAIKVSAGYYYAGTPAAGPGGAAPASCTAGNNGALGNGQFSSANGGCTGTAQYEALAVDYYLSKRTNLYALLGNTTLTGGQKYGYATTAGQTTSNAVLSGQQTYGIGMRHAF